jgi:hypothetical protein
MMYATNGAKSKCKLICVIGYMKLTKSDKISSLEMCTTPSVLVPKAQS